MQRRAWYASVVAVLFMAVALAPVPSVAAHHYDVDRYDELLRSFRGVEVIRDTFELGLDQGYTRYFWTLTPGAPGDPTGNDLDHMAYGYIEVKRAGSGEIMCRGAVASYGPSGIERSCDTLRVGHTYEVTIIMTDGRGSMDLWGYEPEVWPPPGGFNVFNSLPI